MSNTGLQQLLSDVGTMLHYTADEISEDITLKDRLMLIIENGKEHLRLTAPDLTDKDFEDPGIARTLLFNYCRYANSNADEMFDKNYSSELITLRFLYEVRANEDQDGD